VGYAFGLVEPDELPYMVDLHLFLGRRLSQGFSVVKKEGAIGEDDFEFEDSGEGKGGGGGFNYFLKKKKK